MTVVVTINTKWYMEDDEFDRFSTGGSGVLYPQEGEELMATGKVMVGRGKNITAVYRYARLAGKTRDQLLS